MEELELSYIAGGNEKWCSYYGKQFGNSAKILNTELLYNPASPSLGIYPTIEKKDIYTHVHSSTIHNSQKMEKAQMSITG